MDPAETKFFVRRKCCSDTMEIVRVLYSRNAASTDTALCAKSSYKDTGDDFYRDGRTRQARDRLMQTMPAKGFKIVCDQMRENPSGRNRTSDQLISENTETQYTTLQSIALPTELHSVSNILPHQTHKKRCTRFDTRNHTSYAALYITSAMPRILTPISAHQPS